MKVLKPTIRDSPDAMTHIQHSLNTDLVQEGHEFQVMADALRLVVQGNGEQQVIEVLTGHYPGLAGSAPAVVKFVGTYGRAAERGLEAPFVRRVLDLIKHNVVNPGKRRCAPGFWVQLANMPPGNGFAAVALAEANLLCDGSCIQDLVRQFVSIPQLRKFLTGDGRVRLTALNEQIASFSSALDIVRDLQPADRTVASALHGAWCVHIEFKQVAHFPSFFPDENGRVLKMTSFNDATSVAEAYAHIKCKQPLADACPSVLRVDAKSTSKASSPSGSTPPPVSSTYSATGAFVGHYQRMWNLGVQPGAVLMCKKDAQCDGGSIIAKNVKLEVAIADPENNEVVLRTGTEPDGARFTWTLQSFPMDVMVCIELPGKPPQLLDEWPRMDWPLRSLRYKRSLVRGQVAIALDVLHELRSQDTYLQNPEEYFKLRLSPAKRCFAAQELSMDPPVVFIPLTVNVAFKKEVNNPWCPTLIDSCKDGEITVLEPLVRADSEKGASHGSVVASTEPLVVEPFWFVRQIVDPKLKDSANMELVQRSVMLVTSSNTSRMGAPDSFSPPPTEVQIPTLRQTRVIADNEELLVFRVLLKSTSDEPKTKRPRNTI